jgi:hypothetical protein
MGTRKAMELKADVLYLEDKIRELADAANAASNKKLTAEDKDVARRAYWSYLEMLRNLKNIFNFLVGNEKLKPYLFFPLKVEEKEVYQELVDFYYQIKGLQKRAQEI